MTRIIVGFASILILLTFTVLMPPTAFFDPDPTPTEVQIPDERPCDGKACYDSAVFIDDQGMLREVPTPEYKRITWPRRPAMQPQFIPLDMNRPPNRV